MDIGVVEINNYEEYEALKKNHERLIVLYGAKWCKACKDIFPLYQRIGKRYKHRITLTYADIDKCELDFDQVPIFTFVYKGKEVNDLVGADKEDLREFIRNCILHNSKRSTKYYPVLNNAY